jgi:hypothetical protein
MTYIIACIEIFHQQKRFTQMFFCQSINFFLKNLKKKHCKDKRDEDVELSLLEVSLPDTPSVAKLLSSSSHAIRFEEDDFARALIYRGRWWW